MVTAPPWPMPSSHERVSDGSSPDRGSEYEIVPRSVSAAALQNRISLPRRPPNALTRISRSVAARSVTCARSPVTLSSST